MKYLLVLLVVSVGVWILSARFRKQRPGAATRPPMKPRPGDSPAASGAYTKDIVACGRCQVHLPADEAVYQDNVPYCSDSHRKAGPG